MNHQANEPENNKNENLDKKETQTVESSKIAVEVRSSQGSLEIDSDGEIIEYKKDYDPEVPETYFSDIKRFDVKEFLEYWNYEELPSSIDILDLGYWLKDGGFEPPCMDWREEIIKEIRQA